MQLQKSPIFFLDLALELASASKFYCIKHFALYFISASYKYINQKTFPINLRMARYHLFSTLILFQTLSLPAPPPFFSFLKQLTSLCLCFIHDDTYFIRPNFWGDMPILVLVNKNSMQLGLSVIASETPFIVVKCRCNCLDI